jgi:hypothetical protein
MSPAPSARPPERRTARTPRDLAGRVDDLADRSSVPERAPRGTPVSGARVAPVRPGRPGRPAGRGRRQEILFLAANTGDGSPGLALAEECAEIQRELQLTRRREKFHFESRWAVRIDDLMRHLLEVDPTVVHISGHGSADGGMVLQNEHGHDQPVTARALAKMLAAATRRLRVVVLNACYSRAQAEEIAACVDCVVSMDGAIGDDAARTFASGFYSALGNGRSVGNAVQHGVAALAARDLPDERIPRCLARPGVDPDDIVLA